VSRDCFRNFAGCGYGVVDRRGALIESHCWEGGREGGREILIRRCSEALSRAIQAFNAGSGEAKWVVERLD
jgi:hypothetical protein